MTDYVIPLAAEPSQQVTTTINEQRMTLAVYQKRFGLFVDVYNDNGLVIGGVLAKNLNLIVRSAYLGFAGDLFFYDTQGTSDPDYTGLGDRFIFLYTDSPP